MTLPATRSATTTDDTLDDDVVIPVMRRTSPRHVTIEHPGPTVDGTV
jgi:hypothetical protein